MLPKRIVFIRLRSLGDLVLMTPALEIVKEQSACQTAVVVEKPFDQLFNHNPFVDRIIGARHKASTLEKLDLIRQIRAFEPDTVIDLHGGTTSSILSGFSGARQKVGFSSSRSRWIYNTQIPDSRLIWDKQSLHTVEHQLTSLKHLGYEIPPIPDPKVYFGPQDSEHIEQLLQQKNLTPNFILVHPAAAFLTKQWPPERFAALISQLSAERHRVVITAGPGEHELVEKIARLSSNGPAVVPPLSLGRFSALAACCRIYIGNDTGTTHIAAALKKPVVAIFGSSDAAVWYPWNTEHRLLQSDLACIPCPGYHCLHFESPRCIESISFDQVLHAVRELLDMTGKKSSNGITISSD